MCDVPLVGATPGRGPDELPIYADLAQGLGVEQIIFKNLDVILKDGDDERRLFSHDGPPLADVEPVIAEAQKRAKKAGINVRLYALQPQELTICEHDPLHNLFFPRFYAVALRWVPHYNEGGKYIEF